jgi:hypothetical protein
MTKCRGITIPQYKKITEMSWKLKKDGSGSYMAEEIVNKEVEPICADCKRIICKDDYDPRKEEVYLRPT